jgi:hypothetical protein
MNGTILLIILAIVVLGALVALVPLGRHALRLYRSARRAQAELIPLAEGLARRADLAAGKAAALGERGQDLSERLAELQLTVARVNVLARAMHGGSSRWGHVRRYVG